MSHLRYVRGKSVDPTKYTHLPLEVSPAIEGLKDVVFSHPAVKTLEAFGENLASRPLTRDEVRILLASEGLFVLEVPPGVLALSSRITDECFEIDPFQATGRAARVLFAAIDEYGLNAMENGLLPSHHQLYADMAAHWGISAHELLDARYCVPTGREFGKIIRRYYREAPIVEALGFHVANEATAPLDFGVFLKTFQTHREFYGLKAENDSVLNFLLVHDDVEVSHREMGVEMVQLYTEGDPEMIERAQKGVLDYMDIYGRFFAELSDAMFGQRAYMRGAKAS
ncbi:MAG TPA: iron-containing redox enzyme family protein [Dongiaceae bacterium]|nr:iron-containing redox enzyme family protein [Dongiaceae bacterium]